MVGLINWNVIFIYVRVCDDVKDKYSNIELFLWKEENFLSSNE